MSESTWISVKERLPEKPAWYPTLPNDVKANFGNPWSMHLFDMKSPFPSYVTHWFDVPPPPAPEDSPLVQELKELGAREANITYCRGIEAAIEIVRRHESEARK